MSLEYVDWDIGEVTVINLAGRITLGQGTSRLRRSVVDALERDRRKLLLNFDEVFYIDSTGLGELVSLYTRVRRAGGQLKLMKPRQITRDLLTLTKLYTVFEIYGDEPSALKSFER